MAYQPYPYPGYQPAPYYPGPMPDQLAQLRQNQAQQIMQGQQMAQPVQTQPIQPQTVPGTPPFQASGVQDYDNNWVSSQEEANNWLVAPGHSVIMRDVNNRYIYVKSRDANGIPAPLRVFEDTSAVIQQDTFSASQIDLSRYVTIDQLEDILTERLKRPVKAAKTKEDTDNG